MVVPAGLLLPTIFIDQTYHPFNPGVDPCSSCNKDDPDCSAYQEVGGILTPVKETPLPAGWGDISEISRNVKIWAFVVNGTAPDEIYYDSLKNGEINAENLKNIVENMHYTLISNVVETEVELYIQENDSRSFSLYDFDGNGAYCGIASPAGSTSRTPVPR